MYFSFENERSPLQLGTVSQLVISVVLIDGRHLPLMVDSLS